MALQEELKTQGDFLFRHRSYLPLLFLAFGIGVFIHKEFYEVDSQTEHWLFEYDELICLCTCLFGFLIRVIAVGYSPKNTSGRNTKDGQVADTLNTKGLYSIVRHPLYFGNFFMWLGITMLTENFWFIIAFCFLYIIYYERIMFAEENYLRQKFGNTYLGWAKNVPLIIPSLKNYKKYEHSFSIKKVLKKEKNGITAIFLLFWFFELIDATIENRALIIEYNFWFYAAMFSLVLYFILKLLKKRKLL